MNYKKQSINTLIQSCKKKNHKAQMVLYQRFNRSLYFSAYRIVKNQEDALDAVQEGFINAFEKLDQFNETGSFEGWLRKIVVRKSVGYYQQNIRFVRDEQLENKTELSVDEDILQ